jgi:adenylate cyclase
MRRSALMAKHLEIERTWLVDIEDIPRVMLRAPSERIVQGYIELLHNDDPEHTTYRLRKKGDAYFFTWKHGGTTVRMEYEVQLTKEQYQIMWNMVCGCTVEKTRYTLKLHDGRNNAHLPDGYRVELDIFDGTHDGLVLVEVEFDSEEAAKLFKAPDWFGRDVSDDGGYSNYSLAVNGLPVT